MEGTLDRPVEVNWRSKEKHMVATATRNATLQDLAALLQEQHARKVDVVAPADKIRMVDGRLVVKDAETILDLDGVTTTDGVYLPTDVCDEGISDKMKIPLPYVRRMRLERPDLYDANVNGWLHGRRPKVVRRLNQETSVFEEEVVREAVAGDTRSFLIRCFRGDDGSEGIARAFLSDRFKIVDNLDVLTASLDGVREAGVDVNIVGCDLTERRMYVRIVAPEVQAYARELVKNYRSPFSGKRGDENPVCFAGFEIGNSETGNGAFTITPRMVLEVCDNGMKRTVDAIRAVHLGGRMDEGTIAWSDDTREKQVALVKAQTRDAVKTFLDVDYMTSVIAEVEAKAGAPVKDAAKTVQVIGKALQFSTDTITGVLDHFIRGGDVTAGGLMNAVTSFAQTIENADAASDVEESAFKALDMAVLAAR
jgi:hypothetical protein